MKPTVQIYTCLITFVFFISAQSQIPAVHSNIQNDQDNRLYVEFNNEKHYEFRSEYLYSIKKLQGNPKGTDSGITFDFNDSTFAGILYYGFIPYGDSKHPSPVYFKYPAPIKDGITTINIMKNLMGKYDMVGWEETQKGTIGYRVVNERGEILYDGKVSFRGMGPFKVDITLTDGPFVDCISESRAVISFKTNRAVPTRVIIDDKTFRDTKSTVYHEITITGLKADTKYSYRVQYGDNEQSFSFNTAPKPGSRKPFVFSYCSDSRSGQGGGERDLFGTNFYIMRKIMALSSFKNVVFMQFTGDLIDGYLTDVEAMNLQYNNWKRAIEPYAHYIPVYEGMGNHESVMRSFGDRNPWSKTAFGVDRFPYDQESSEKLFANNFVNPKNGPQSEDGTSYDPDPKTQDFPCYSENVFYYIYDNVAVIVLNSNYWYAPSTHHIPHISGGVHGYIMDQQLDWFKTTVEKFENDLAIDHIFVTVHTPFFPNGGHVMDDMWYNGNNLIRPSVAGIPLEKGIIERRDDLLDIIVNKSLKTVAILTGDEHNYNKLKITDETVIYPPNYDQEKINISRPIYQINNGAAGAPYYAQESVPWSTQVTNFTTQHALVFFHIDGKSVFMEVLNPVTLEEIDQLKLR
ncbi:MAG: hypothetical protein GQ561_07015 [Calditrichae bacterium]|nr:hypothetical protein [Calditrichia bacterium]